MPFHDVLVSIQSGLLLDQLVHNLDSIHLNVIEIQEMLVRMSYVFGEAFAHNLGRLGIDGPHLHLKRLQLHNLIVTAASGFRCCR